LKQGGVHLILPILLQDQDGKTFIVLQPLILRDNARWCWQNDLRWALLFGFIVLYIFYSYADYSIWFNRSLSLRSRSWSQKKLWQPLLLNVKSFSFVGACYRPHKPGKSKNWDFLVRVIISLVWSSYYWSWGKWASGMAYLVKRWCFSSQ
jgi:hypothetical protein